MAQNVQYVRLEEVDWPAVLPWLRLTGAFRMALAPAKLGVALVLVLLLYLTGLLVDATGWAGPVYPGQSQQFAVLDDASFEAWVAGREEWTRRRLYEELAGLSEQPGAVQALVESAHPFEGARAMAHEHFVRRYQQFAARRSEMETHEYQSALRQLHRQRSERLRAIAQLQPQGLFAATLHAQVTGFERMMRAASSLRFGLTELLSGVSPPPQSVLGALRGMLISVPSWLAARHPVFLSLYLAWGLVLWSLLGGAVARLAAVHACRDQRQGAGAGLSFALRQWRWFLAAPLLPLVLAVALGLLLVLTGLVFFNWPLLDAVGGLVFGLSLVAGAMVAVLLVGLAAASGLLYPALAVENTDGFDAIARAFNYVLGRPWRWLFYNAVALVYGAVCYLFVAAMVFLTIALTHTLLSLGVFRSGELGVNRFKALMPAPRLGELSYALDPALLDVSGRAAAVMVKLWNHLCLGLLAAFAISFYFSAQTWIYLLLRRSADGTGFDQLAPPSAKDDLAAATPEPAAASADET